MSQLSVVGTGVHSHAPSIRSHRGIKVVWPDLQPMRIPEEPVCVRLFRQKPVFTSLHLKSPVHVHRLGANWQSEGSKRLPTPGSESIRKWKTGSTALDWLETSGTVLNKRDHSVQEPSPIRGSPREHTKWQRPISGVHSIMMEKLALACEGGNWEVYAHPLFTLIPSRTKFQCTLKVQCGPLTWYFSTLPRRSTKCQGRGCWRNYVLMAYKVEPWTGSGTGSQDENRE